MKNEFVNNTLVIIGVDDEPISIIVLIFDLIEGFMEYKVVNIVLCYKNENEVLAYAKKLANQTAADCIALVVVINARNEMSEEKFRESLEATSIDSYIFDPGANLGYMNGLNYGYHEYLKNGNVPKYAVYSNTDIDYKSEVFFETLLSKQYSEDVKCIGPAVSVSSLETYDNPIADNRRTIREINSLIRRFSLPVFCQIYVWLAFIKPMIFKREKDMISRNVYEVHGCFFIIEGTFASVFCKEEYEPLMYSEETFVAENIFREGYTEYYDAELEVIHLEHTVTKTLKPKLRAEYMAESMKWIRKKYYDVKI